MSYFVWFLCCFGICYCSAWLNKIAQKKKKSLLTHHVVESRILLLVEGEIVVWIWTGILSLTSHVWPQVSRWTFQMGLSRDLKAFEWKCAHNFEGYSRKVLKLLKNQPIKLKLNQFPCLIIIIIITWFSHILRCLLSLLWSLSGPTGLLREGNLDLASSPYLQISSSIVR